MDVNHHNDGRWYFSLGPVEKWLVGIIASAVVTVFGMWCYSIQTTMSQQVTEQALANQQLRTITVQLADVPTLKQRVAENSVVIQRNTSDIRDNAEAIRRLEEKVGHP